MEHGPTDGKDMPPEKNFASVSKNRFDILAIEKNLPRQNGGVFQRAAQNESTLDQSCSHIGERIEIDVLHRPPYFYDGI